jgi:hypothetical protein
MLDIFKNMKKNIKVSKSAKIFTDYESVIFFQFFDIKKYVKFKNFFHSKLKSFSAGDRELQWGVIEKDF